MVAPWHPSVKSTSRFYKYTGIASNLLIINVKAPRFYNHSIGKEAVGAGQEKRAAKIKD